MRSCRSKDPRTRFQRSLATRNLRVILSAAAELQWINLADSLEILALMAQAGDPRFERAAARWVGRLLTETPPMTLKEAPVGNRDGGATPALPRIAARACASAVMALLTELGHLFDTVGVVGGYGWETAFTKVESGEAGEA